MEPIEALEQIAYRLETALEPAYRVKAFRGAADVLRGLAPGELEDRVRTGRLRDLKGIGDTTAKVITEALAGEVPAYLRHLEADAGEPLPEGAAALRAALRGDLHCHSDWSDGGSPIDTMARAAAALGHEYMALTDHSPRLKVANGLTRDRILRQLDLLDLINQDVAPFRILAGIEVDILEDGSLDQDDDILERLDVVVASVHSKLSMEKEEMTRRMLLAISNPHMDILGHCTGRKIVGKGRPESEFDAPLVFAACLKFDKALEINCRPERLDPPRRLLRTAVDMGLRFSIDTDAHAPGQLDWQPYGCLRAAECGVSADRVVNTLPAPRLLEWTASHTQ